MGIGIKFYRTQRHGGTEFLEAVLNFYQKFFSCHDVFVFVCALGDFLVLFTSVLRQIARYLPHHRSENASKTHPKSSHDKFKTVSEFATIQNSFSLYRKIQNECPQLANVGAGLARPYASRWMFSGRQTLPLQFIGKMRTFIKFQTGSYSCALFFIRSS